MMKKRVKVLLATALVLLLICVAPVIVSAAAGDVAINESNFPDGTFRQYVKRFDSNGDGILSQSECNSVTGISVANSNITTLKGLEYFPNLTTLRCYNNKLTSLDVTKNTKLEELYCYSNQITSLDVTKNPKLWMLNPKDNLLTGIDVSKNPELYNLCVIRNKITSLDVSNNPNLGVLYLRSNNLKTLDVSKNANLSILWVDGNQFACLDLSKNSQITDLLTNDNTYTITQTRNNTFDLSTIPGFKANLASNWKGGTVSGNILTIDVQGTAVTYTYDVDGAAGSKTAQFNLKVANPSKPTTYINSVALTGLDAPVAGKELDKAVSCGTTGVTAPSIVWEKKSGSSYAKVTGKADYNTTYRAVITLSPDWYYKFKADIQGTVNGKSAAISYDSASGNIVLSVEYTTPKEKLLSIEKNNSLDVAANISLDKMELPSHVAVVTDGKITNSAPVDWNISNPVFLEGSFDIDNMDGYSFVLQGTVTCPDSVDATGVELTTQIKVTVAKEEVKETQTAEEETQEITTQAQTEAATDASAEDTSDEGGSSLWWLWLVLAGVIIVFIIIFIILKKRKNDDEEEKPEE